MDFIFIFNLYTLFEFKNLEYNTRKLINSLTHDIIIIYYSTNGTDHHVWMINLLEEIYIRS
jgi:hypothetical protein